MSALTPEGNKLIDGMIATHDDVVRAAERERCAKIALDLGKHYGEAAVGSAIANAIRALG